MFGIGPMLPVIPTAEKSEHSSKKVQKRRNNHALSPGGHELVAMRRPSTIKTESTLIESNDGNSVIECGNTVHHQRDLSLIVDFDLERMASQLLCGMISDLDLALFAFWIKAKNENYRMARELVRELALDQGYNIDKIVNPRVRKLLQEIHDIRPRSVPRKNPSTELAAMGHLRHDRQRSLVKGLKPVRGRSKVRFAAVGESAKTKSNKLNTRDPRHSSTWNSTFHSQTQISDASTGGSIRAAASSLTARMDTLPPSLRLKRERAVQEAARSTMASGNSARYPPNTPDRPAPLSVKSRGSHISNATAAPNSIPRSVSTPIRTQAKGDLTPLPHRTVGAMVGESEALSLKTSSTTRVSPQATGDIFDAAQGKIHDHSDPFTDRLNQSKEVHHGSNEHYLHNNAGGDHIVGPFQLDASDAASESSYGTFSSLVRKNKVRASTDVPYDGGIIGDDSFDALESYVDTEDEDVCSLLESASTNSDKEVETQYQFATQAFPLQPVITKPAPTSSQRHAIAEARRKSPSSNRTSTAINFHRPLPLRSYESEASMFPTAGAQAKSGRNRAKSVTSIIASKRPATETMPPPAFPGLSSSQARSSTDYGKQNEYKTDDSHTKVSENVDQHSVSISQRSSRASTLAAFPIPPMDNPVGELPMLISRATSSPQGLHTIPSQHRLVSASLDDTYRAITKVNMVALLQRTRARGEQLHIVEWDKLTSFERAWREMNEVLLVTVYGRKDVVLADTDVAYIDCVVRELCNVSDVPDDWIRCLFEVDV